MVSQKADNIQVIRTDSTNPDFIQLVRYLDAYLAEKDGEDASFYASYNKIDMIRYVVVAYINDKPIGCGAIKAFDDQSMEVKRMYTAPEFRGQGIASNVLHELEKWTAELGYRKCVLETGKRQHEAIQLYKNKGYQLIPNYGQYIGMDNSLCFEKNVTTSPAEA